MIHVTDGGRRLAHELIPFSTEHNRTALAGFTRDDVDTLMALLLRLQQNLRRADAEQSRG